MENGKNRFLLSSNPKYFIDLIYSVVLLENWYQAENIFQTSKFCLFFYFLRKTFEIFKTSYNYIKFKIRNPKNRAPGKLIFVRSLGTICVFLTFTSYNFWYL